jgi:hypothetical protein
MPGGVKEKISRWRQEVRGGVGTLLKASRRGNEKVRREGSDSNRRCEGARQGFLFKDGGRRG